MDTEKHGFRAGADPGIRNASSSSVLSVKSAVKRPVTSEPPSAIISPSGSAAGGRGCTKQSLSASIRFYPWLDPREVVRQRLVALGPSVVGLRLLAVALFLSAGAVFCRGDEAASEKKLPLPGEVWRVDGRTAFLIPAAEPPPADRPKPWVWYAPTLPPYPGDAERWMFERFTRAGVAIAGIDVGESYGSPAGRGGFSALYAELTGRRGYSARPVLLGRSRGGLQLINWAVDHPAQVSAFAGIYPVCNLASYPGLAKAAPAYGLTLEQLTAGLARHNPVDRLAPLAAAGVPLFAIHGDVDRLVPLELNSGLLRERYTALGGTMTLVVPPGQGHSMWPGFFQSEELVAFVLQHAFR